MLERLYTEHPELYDVLQSDYDYERDLSFIRETTQNHGSQISQVLEIGCGTGEHTRRLVDSGFHVTAVDKHEGMLDIARDKCDAEFQEAALPSLDLDRRFDLVVAIRGVVNHLLPGEVNPAFEAIHRHLNQDGIFIFDNARLPQEGNEVGLDVGTSPTGDYAKLAQHVATGEGYLEWRSVIFGPSGEFFVNTRPMTPFDDERLRTMLIEIGFDVRTVGGFGSKDDRTVFVARI